MNRKKLWLTAFVLALGGTVSFAQEQKIKEEGKIEFKPHWFMQVQAGAAHTVGEAKFLILFLRLLLLISVISLPLRGVHG